MKMRLFSAIIVLAMIIGMVPIYASAETSIPDVNWEAVPIVRQDTKNAGFSGGEGCQWPQAIVSSEADPNFMIFCTDVGGVYVSYDRGENWQPSNAGLDSNGCGSPTVDPRNANRVLMFGGNGDVFPANGLYLSKDKGKTWKKVIDNNIKGFRNFKTQIAYDPTSYNASLGYCTVAYWSAEGYTKPWWMGGQTIEPKMYKTTDGGDSWAEIANSTTYASSWLEVSSTGILYSGNNSGLYRSTDGGTSFTKIMDAKTVTNNSPQDPENLQGTTGLEVVGTTVYASMFDGLYISTNNGDSFSKKECIKGPAALGFQRLTVSKVNPNYMMMSNNEGYSSQVSYYTKDGGTSWLRSKLNTTNSFFASNNRQGLFTYDTLNPEFVWSVGGDYISRSSNGGKDFEYYSNGYTGIMMGGLMSFNPQHPELVLIASQDYNAAYSTDYGKTFKNVLVSGAGWGGYCYGAYPVDAQTLVVGNRDSWGGDTQIKVSRDGGDTWQASGIYTSGIASIFGDQTNSDIIFAYNYRSIDKGYNWTQMTDCDAVITYNPVNKDMYGIKGSTVVKSSDSGATWQTAATFGGTIEDIAYDHTRNRIYATIGMNLYASDNGGTPYNMTDRMPVDQTNSYRIRTVAVDPNNTNIIYAGGAGNTYISDTGTMRSLDGGATWHSINKSARGISPWADNSIDGGREPMSLRVNPYTSDLFVGTCCLGVWKLPSDNSVNNSIKLNRNNAFIKINETTTLTASISPSTVTNVSWSSSDTTVATVSASGVVTGLKSGTATITAQTTISGTSYTDTCTVAVQKPDFAIINPSVDCVVGETVYVSAVATTMASQPNVTYSISTVPSTGVATINSSTGEMNIQGKGKITVTASATIGTANEALTHTKVFTARDDTTGDTLYSYQGDVPWGIWEDYIMKDTSNNEVVLSGDYQIRFSMQAGDNGYQFTEFKFAYTDASNYAYVRANCSGGWSDPVQSVKVGYVSGGTDTVLADLPLSGYSYSFYCINLKGSDIEAFRYVGTERQDIYSSSSFPISSTGKMAGFRSNDGYWGHKLDTVIVKEIVDIETEPEGYDPTQSEPDLSYSRLFYDDMTSSANWADISNVGFDESGMYSQSVPDFCATTADAFNVTDKAWRVSTSFKVDADSENTWESAFSMTFGDYTLAVKKANRDAAYDNIMKMSLIKNGETLTYVDVDGYFGTVHTLVLTCNDGHFYIRSGDASAYYYDSAYNMSVGKISYSASEMWNQTWTTMTSLETADCLEIQMPTVLTLATNSGAGIITGGYLRSLAFGMTADSLTQEFKYAGFIKVTDAAGQVVEGDSVIGSGFKASLVYGGETVDTVTVLIYGDINGDGVLTSVDSLKVTRHIIGASALEGFELMAADTCRDDEGTSISTSDLLFIKQAVLGLTQISQK